MSSVSGPAAPFFALFLSEARDLQKAKALQSLAMSALFILSTLITQSATWDGTWRGLATVFFAVIAVDVTVDALITRLTAPRAA